MDIATVKKGNVKLLLTVAASSVLKSPDLHHKVSGGGYQQHGALSKDMVLSVRKSSALVLLLMRVRWKIVKVERVLWVMLRLV